MNLSDLIRTVPGYDPYRDAGKCTFEEDAAERGLEFFRRYVTHIEGDLAGQPYVLQPHEAAIVANIVGWKRPDESRRYREVLYYVARKNSKSTLAAGLLLLFLFCDREPGGQYYSTAADREQAALVFRIAKGMVLNNTDLSAIAEIYAKSIAVGDGIYKAISADANTKHGYNTHVAINDEIHAHRNSELLDVMLTSMGARSQPIAIHITTADYEREGSVCNAKHEYAKKVRDGIIDDPYFLPVIYEVSLEEAEAVGDDGLPEWRKPEIWAKANPMLDIIPTLRPYLERECQRAAEEPAYENVFKRLHLNIRTETVSKLLSQELWSRGAGALDLAAFKGKQCLAGLDLGSTSDLTSICLLFGDKESGWSALWKHWLPEITAKDRERKQRIPYSSWQRGGWITLTDGDEIDYRLVRADINALADTYGIEEIAIDRLFQGAQLAQDLGDDGFNIVEFGQGFASMAAPTVEFIRALRAGKFRHGDNPLVAWQASNVVARMDPAGNIKPDKQKSGNKIDAIVAAVMAVGRGIEHKPKAKSVYEERGMLTL